MSFLVAEILGLLALAALFGGAFVYWWLRRSLVDVSSEYALYQTGLTELDDLRKSHSAADARIAALEAEGSQLEARLNDELEWRPALEGKLEALKPASLEPVMGHLSGLTDAVAKIRPADLSGLEYKLNVLQGGVANLENTDVSGLVSGVAAVSATVAALKPTDLTAVQAKLEDVERRVAALRNTDLSGIDARLTELDSRVAKLRNADFSTLEGRLASVERTLSGIRPADLKPVEERVAGLDQRVRGLRNADLSGVDGRVKGLTDAVKRLEGRIQPHPPAPDFSGIHQRLDAFEKALKANLKPAPEAPRRPGGNLLRSASFGKPDDLKRISGIGPQLEKMLHGIGVYYFWQVADWDGSDVRHVDDLLDAFKGRISRDKWVKQAGGLARQPGSAKRAGSL